MGFLDCLSLLMIGLKLAGIGVCAKFSWVVCIAPEIFTWVVAFIVAAFKYEKEEKTSD